MKTFVLASALFGLTASLTATASSAAVGVNRGDCYNILITWCNDNSNHPQACANTVMDACDDMHRMIGGDGQPLPLAAKPDDDNGRKPDPKPDPKPRPDPKPDPKPGRDATFGSAKRG